MFSRRGLMVAAAAPLAARVTSVHAASALPVPPTGQIGFRMKRNGDVIGTHALTFNVQGEEVVVSVAIDILVKFGPIPVYRYKHRATERWTGGRFDGIESQTDRDGSAHWMRAARRGDAVMVEGNATQPYAAPPMTFPTTYWNKAMLQDHVINSEDGRLFDIKPTALAVESVPLANGGTARARRYRLDGDLMLDLWYDDAGQWAHLVFNRDGSTVIYEKL